MVASAWCGYDPETMTWSEIAAEALSSLETSTPKEEIVDEGLFSLVALRKRQQRPNTSAVNGLSISAGVSVPPNTARTNPQLSPAAGSTKWRPTAMPRLRKEDFTIVIKPRVTISLKTALQNDELGGLLSVYVNPSSVDIHSVWPIWDQNIVIATTQDVNAANALAREFTLNASKGPIPVVGHAKVNSEVCRGIITVHEQETSTTPKSKVQWRGGAIAFIRKLGKSTIALLTFVGHRVPRYVHYNSVVTVVREYKRTIPACFRCGTIGHRPDLCPNPQDNRCGHCGETVAVLEDGNMAPHECTASCIVCGGGHLTGSQDCKAKFQRLQQPGNPTGQRTQPRTAVPSGPVTTSKAPTPSNKKTKGTTVPAPPAGTLPGRAPKSPRSTNPKASRNPDAPTFQDGDFPALQGAPSGAPKNTSQSKTSAASSRLRAQNAQLNAKIHALETARSSPPPAQVAPERIQVVPADPTHSSSELRFTALENALSELTTQISNFGQIQDSLLKAVTATVTAAVTANIKTWLESNPRLLRRTGRLKDANRPSKFTRPFDLTELSEEPESLPLQVTEPGPALQGNLTSNQHGCVPSQPTP
ncbi:hypothetical protein HPB49_007014 [Dermacentor silvarum]|uniref:Uncharacterized protein n=1 Tax=Dermacentor silvarum TaxID=543639 RepID=A0ACB8DX54_DERSI|nr:hypothetical protein HPB49_007014 [Dermacentor silvarum]